MIVTSTWRDVSTGVLQGSILNPLLFVIYINGLDVRLLSKITKFADDAKIGINTNEESDVKQLQEDFDKIKE